MTFNIMVRVVKTVARGLGLVLRWERFIWRTCHGHFSLLPAGDIVEKLLKTTCQPIPL
jgi:hypothetical protein